MFLEGWVGAGVLETTRSCIWSAMQACGRRLHFSCSSRRIVRPSPIPPSILQPQHSRTPCMFTSNHQSSSISTFRQRLKHSCFVSHFLTSLFNITVFYYNSIPWTSKWIGPWLLLFRPHSKSLIDIDDLTLTRDGTKWNERTANVKYLYIVQQST